MAVRFFLQNTAEYYSGFDEAYQASQWKGFGATVPALNTSFDDPHGSVMQLTSATTVEAYQQFTVKPDVKYVFEAEYYSTNTITFEMVDVSNGGAVIETKICAASSPYWANYYHEETVASDSTQCQLWIIGGVGETIYLDNVVFQGNALLFDPAHGQTPYSYNDESQRHVMQDGSIRTDRTPRRINIELNFPVLSHEYFTRLQDFVNDGDETWFDDQAVPNSIDEGYMYNEATDTYASTLYNKAYYASSATLTASATVFEINEFSAASYTAIAVDNSSRAMTAAGAPTQYVFHKFSIPLTEITSLAEIQSLDILYKGDSEDNYQGTGDGVKLYLWDGSKYVEIDSAYSTDESTLNFNTTKPSLAQRFVYSSGATLYIKALAKTAFAYHLPAANLYLRSYYFRTIVNDNLSTTIALKDKAILDSNGDVVEVKNITRDSVLTLGTDYRISEDRQSVICSSQTVGDKIQVEYKHYWHVVPGQIFNDNRLGGAATAPDRSVTLSLEGITTL